MSVEFPLDAFDDTNIIVRRKARSRFNRAKIASFSITAAIHVMVAILAFSAVQQAPAQPPKALSVQIAPKKPKPQLETAPFPQMLRPPVISSIMPEVVIESAPNPLIAQPPVSRPATQATVPSPPRAAPEGGQESYTSRLLAHLNRHKQYPRAARMARMQGAVMLHFVMDAQGWVKLCEIHKSSGHASLDAEALAMVARAQPLPPLPADFPTKTLDAVVPVEFFLNR